MEYDTQFWIDVLNPPMWKCIVIGISIIIVLIILEN